MLCPFIEQPPSWHPWPYFALTIAAVSSVESVPGLYQELKLRGLLHDLLDISGGRCGHSKGSEESFKLYPFIRTHLVYVLQASRRVTYAHGSCFTQLADSHLLRVHVA